MTTRADRLTTEAESGKKSSGQYGRKTRPVGRGERVAEKYFGSAAADVVSVSDSSDSSGEESASSSSSSLGRGRWASAASD